MFIFPVQLAAILASLCAFQLDGDREWFVVAPPGAGATVEMPTIPQFRQQMLRPVRDLDEILVRNTQLVLEQWQHQSDVCLP